MYARVVVWYRLLGRRFPRLFMAIQPMLLLLSVVWLFVLGLRHLAH
jgi:hypothetical protein